MALLYRALQTLELPCVQVRVWVPAAVMRRAQAMMVQGTGPGSSGLTLTVLSDFQESGVPLQVIPACPIYPPHKQPTPQSLLKACVKWLHFTCSKVASLRRTFLLQASVVLHETYTLARMCDCFTGVRGGFCAPLFCQCR